MVANILKIEEAIEYLLLGKGEMVAMSFKVDHPGLVSLALATGRLVARSLAHQTSFRTFVVVSAETARSIFADRPIELLRSEMRAVVAHRAPLPGPGAKRMPTRVARFADEMRVKTFGYSVLRCRMIANW
ncbi:MAG: hypothetical protein Q8Q26_14975 [Pseudorhodobacter sp.]|nr:hypothetical protein [Pseudorhodobacter sp.]